MGLTHLVLILSVAAIATAPVDLGMATLVPNSWSLSFQRDVTSSFLLLVSGWD